MSSYLKKLAQAGGVATLLLGASLGTAFAGAIHNAAKRRDYDLVRYIVEGTNGQTQAAVDEQDSRGRTALFYVATHWFQGGRDDIAEVESAKFLIEKGADVNAQAKDGRGPFLIALQTLKHMYDPIDETGSYEMIDLLMDKGANVNLTDNQGRTPLYWASSVGSLAVFTKLVDAGANMRALDIEGNTILHRLVKYRFAESIFNYVLGKNAIPIDHLNDAGRTAFSQLIEWNYTPRNLRLLTALLDAGSDPNAGVGWYGVKPIHNAVDYPVALTDKMILAGVNYYTKNRNGDSCLSEALRRNKTDHITAYMNAGFDPNYGGSTFFASTLFDSVYYVMIDKLEESVLDLLIASGLDLNRVFNLGDFGTEFENVTILDLVDARAPTWPWSGLENAEMATYLVLKGAKKYSELPTETEGETETGTAVEIAESVNG